MINMGLRNLPLRSMINSLSSGLLQHPSKPKFSKIVVKINQSLIALVVYILNPC